MKTERSERLVRLRHAQTEGKRAQVALRGHTLLLRREELRIEGEVRASRVEALRQSEGQILTGTALADLHAGAEQVVRSEVRARRRAEAAERGLAEARSEATEAHREEERMRRLHEAERERTRTEQVRQGWALADEQMLSRLAARDSGLASFTASEDGEGRA